jgi:hypothetical protein
VKNFLIHGDDVIDRDTAEPKEKKAARGESRGLEGAVTLRRMTLLERQL